MQLKPLLFVLSLSLPLGAVAQTGVVIAPSQAIVSFTIGDAPTITSPNSAAGTLGTLFNYQITGINNPTGFSATGLPATLTLNPSTGLISGTPSVASTYYITVTTTNATDSYTTTLTLTISNVPNADDDGDGIPNDWELAYGLNPNVATDAAQTFPGTGLSYLTVFKEVYGRVPAGSTMSLTTAAAYVNVGLRVFSPSR